MRHKNNSLIVVLLILGFLASGCATKTETGAGIGALAGAAIGSQFGPADRRLEGAILGAFIGAALGSVIGNEMDKKDREQLSQVYESGRSGVATSWVNPDTGSKFKVTPKPAFKGLREQPCREARIDAIINNNPETVVTTACRAEDGMWELQK